MNVCKSSKGDFLKLFLSLIIVLLLTFPAALATAQNTGSLLDPGSQPSSKAVADDANTSVNSPKAKTPAFPNLSEVVPRASDLISKADVTRKVIANSINILSRIQEIDEIQARQQKLQNLILKISDTDGWDAGEIFDANIVIMREKTVLKVLLASFSSALADLESNRSDWQKRQAYWREWRVFLDVDSSQTLKDPFDAAQVTIGKILEDLANAINSLFATQERVSRLVDENLRLGEIVETAFSSQRSNVFKKMDKSFFDADFYTQFNASFWLSFRDNIGKFDDPFDSRSARFMAVRGAIILICVFLILSLKGIPQVRQDRQFLLHHPLSFAIFISEVLPIIFFDPPTGLARDLSWTLLVFSQLILISASLKIRLRRSVICFLAALVIVPGLLKFLPLPSSLFRIYWAVTTLTGTFLFLIWSRQITSHEPARRTLFRRGLQVGALVMALATAAQVAGFVKFFESLLYTSLKVGFLITTIILFLQINSTMILLLEHSLLANRSFIRRYGKELGAKLEGIFKIAIFALGFISFFPIIGIYSSTGQAFQQLFLFQVTVGNLTLSPLVVTLAILVLYLTSFTSWVLRGILEVDVFPRMQMDSGAAQSITKLMNYCLILIGLLISMGVIGFDLKSFAVLGGALGIGIGFGLQNIVNNFLSGLILLFERPVRVGDRIEADDKIGIVKKIGLRSTVIETLDKAQLIVPNSKLISENVINWTHSGTEARLKIPVGVAYGSDMDLVFDTMIAAAQISPHVLKKPKPIVLLLGFGDSSLNVELHVWLFDVNETRLAQSEISREILRRFEEAGIEIPFPQRDVSVRYQDDVHPANSFP